LYQCHSLPVVAEGHKRNAAVYSGKLGCELGGGPKNN